MTGDLTLHGITKPITLLQVEPGGVQIDPWRKTRVGFAVSGTLNRSDYGMKLDQALGSGNLMVSDKIRIHLDISAVKQDDASSHRCVAQDLRDRTHRTHRPALQT